MKPIMVEERTNLSYSRENKNKFIVKNILVAKIDSYEITDQSGNSYDISEAKIIKNSIGAPKLAELWIKGGEIVLVILK
ncbi:MAG: hypothetical protein JRI45_10050 [Deltaproteobacteria bacterium]|nr:hypothetical protein [Deltaproteobacteria bacterium]MBW2068688.1 hypothetical protein [Deltaproteobacteria bacterium]